MDKHTIDYRLITDIKIDGVDILDYPEYHDAYIYSAMYNGMIADDDILDMLNDDKDFVYDCIMRMR